ncbi:MAG: acyl-CoA/acyl-ACP dehydrogenase [Acidobacteria bacterium]|nr:acyl-CoA/acyl-ACP dehydrogenase [Acidobacteriota bacterium]
MDFGFTEEQELLRDTARTFVERNCPPEKAKQWDDESYFPADVVAAMGDMGWFGLPFPEAWGGGGGGPIELAVLAEELSRASFDIGMLYIGTFIPGLALYDWGNEEQRARYQEGMLTGSQRFAVSISEPDAGSDLGAIRASAVRDGDHYVLNGTKMWCTGAGLPNCVIVMYVRTDPGSSRHNGLSVLIVDPSMDGVEIRRTPTLARHILGTNEIYLRDVHVPAENLVGPENQGWDVLMSNLELERTIISGSYVGAAQSTLDIAVAYAKEREQFGRKVGNFQAITHQLADLQVDIDSARLLTYRAAWLLAQGKPVAREASMAKLKGSETYVNVARWGMQIMAAYGFSTESVMSHRYRESIVAPISGGTSQIQRNAIARSMGLKGT